MSQIKKLQGIIIDAEPTNEIRIINGQDWRKYVFILNKLQFSKRGKERLPENLKDKRVRLVRYTLYDWHNKVGVKKTLTVEETKAVLSGTPSETVFW